MSDSEDSYVEDTGTMEVINFTDFSLSEISNRSEELELKYISDPSSNDDRWTLPILIGYDVNGRLREWQIWFQRPDLYISHGLQDGKKQLDSYEVKINQSGRNIYEQSWLEACQRYKKMVRKGYRMDGEADSNMFKVMRAQIFTNNSVITFPCFYDFKMDGYRHYICCNNGKIQGYSREGSLRTNLGHMDDLLLHLFEFLPPGTILDTELYIHGMVFEDISSAIRTQLTDHQLLSQLQVHIFDACWDRVTPFEQRRNRLELAMMKFYDQAGIEYRRSGYPELVKSRDLTDRKIEVEIGINLISRSTIQLSLGFIAYDREELEYQMHKSVRALREDRNPYSSSNLRRGYEGIMIKRLTNESPINTQAYKMASYFYGKCSHIYKYKLIQDMEGLCIGVEDSTGREKGCAMLKIIILSGVTFMLKMDGSQERRRLWFSNPHLVVGKLITFNYQRLSNEGVPMFAVGRRIRDDVSMTDYIYLIGEAKLTNKREGNHKIGL